MELYDLAKSVLSEKEADAIFSESSVLEIKDNFIEESDEDEHGLSAAQIKSINARYDAIMKKKAKIKV